MLFCVSKYKHIIEQFCQIFLSMFSNCKAQRQFLAPLSQVHMHTNCVLTLGIVPEYLIFCVSIDTFRLGLHFCALPQ